MEQLSQTLVFQEDSIADASEELLSWEQCFPNVDIKSPFAVTRAMGIMQDKHDESRDGGKDYSILERKLLTIAQEEFKQKKMPFIIRRPLPDGSSEYWKIEDLEILEV